MKIIENEDIEKSLREMFPNLPVERVKWEEGPTLRLILENSLSLHYEETEEQRSKEGPKDKQEETR